MTQGRGGEELATPHSRGRQEQQSRKGGRVGGGVEQPYGYMQLYVADECIKRNEWQIVWQGPSSTNKWRVC